MDGRLDEALKVLGIPPGSDHESVASAYRRLARATHPDVSTDPDATAQFAAVTAAYRLVCRSTHARPHPRLHPQDGPASTSWSLGWPAPAPNLYQPEDLAGGWSTPTWHPRGRFLLGVSPVAPARLWRRPPIVAGPVLVRRVQTNADSRGRDG
jgi:DnaJ domain